MELLHCLVFMGVGGVVGGFMTWAYFRQATQGAFQQALANSVSQRMQMETQLILTQQRVAEMATELMRREERIEGFIAERQLEIERRAALEVKARRVTDLEESLDEIESKLEESYQKLADFAARAAELTVALENEKSNSAEKLQLLNETQQKLSDTIKVFSSAALRQDNQPFLDLATATLEKFQDSARVDLDYSQQSISEHLRPVRESLAKVESRIREMELTRASAFSGLESQIRALAESEHLLRAEAANLARALRSPGARGGWGEIQLRRVVEMAGMQKHCDFVDGERFKIDNGQPLPDLIVNLPAGRTIVVDAKAPVNAYWEASKAPDEQTRLARLRDHALAVRNHINALSKKSYWDTFNPSPEFVFLFLPGECFYSAALEQDDSLIEYGFERGVVLATPTMLIALLKAVAFGWRQEIAVENARLISALGRELYDRLATMTNHFNRLGHSLGGAMEAYNNAAGAFERRVLASARKFKEMDAAPDDVEIAEIISIDQLPRTLRAPESEPFTAIEGV
ncbi:MAG: DNA recombination protein RmuC [Acidobacteria bacterium]|nr:DNA recombination protein RmuC [Acidobacteriota bacterium]